MSAPHTQSEPETRASTLLGLISRAYQPDT